MPSNSTSKSAYIRHAYSGPRKSRKRVQAALKRYCGEISRDVVWRRSAKRDNMLPNQNASSSNSNITSVSQEDSDSQSIVSSDQPSVSQEVSGSQSSILSLDQPTFNEVSGLKNKVLRTYGRRNAAKPKDASQEDVSRKRETNQKRTVSPPGLLRNRIVFERPVGECTSKEPQSLEPTSVSVKVKEDPLFEEPMIFVFELPVEECTSEEPQSLERTPVCVKVEDPLSEEPMVFESTPVSEKVSANPLSEEPMVFETTPLSVKNEVDPLSEQQMAFEFADVEGGDTPMHASPPSAIGVQDEQFPEALEEWLETTNMHESDDDDDDFDGDFDGLTPIATRNALTEPCCDSDFSVLQSDILRREDDCNDRALRAIMPEDYFTFSWSKDRATFFGRRETFTGTPGPTFVVTEDTRPIDIFDKTFDVNFIDLLVRETNRNAEQKIALLLEQNSLGPSSRYHRWTPTNRDEMVTFLSIIILQGLYPLPEEDGYFHFNGFGTMPYFSKIMIYSRFILLKTFLHFVDNETCQDQTRLASIRPVIDYFNDKFSSMYMPSQEIVIDESLSKHGRLNFTQKISTKAAQVGTKIYELCESSSGYLWKFFVYAEKGKPTPLSTDDNAGDRQTDGEGPAGGDEADTNDGPSTSTGEDTDRPTNATARIVYDLIEPLLHRGHTVIMDNFYNSPLLLRSLKRQKTDCYGTLRLNREFVPDSVKTLTKTNLRQGEVVATYCSDLAIMVWRDANLVSMISTYHNLLNGTHDKYNRVTNKPTIVLDYNKSMGGVDRKDQFLAAQPIERSRNKTWYKKLFRRLFNVAIFNGYVIFGTANRRLSHRQYRTVLAEELLKRHRHIDLASEYRQITRKSLTGQVTIQQRRTTTRPNIQPRHPVEGNHFPIKSSSRFHHCIFCSKKRRTVWMCEQCNLHLCIEGCFKLYHTPP